MVNLTSFQYVATCHWIPKPSKNILIFRLRWRYTIWHFQTSKNFACHLVNFGLTYGMFVAGGYVRPIWAFLI